MPDLSLNILLESGIYSIVELISYMTYKSALNQFLLVELVLIRWRGETVSKEQGETEEKKKGRKGKKGVREKGRKCMKGAVRVLSGF